MSTSTFSVGQNEVNVLQNKYPDLIIELPQSDEVFQTNNLQYCGKLDIEKAQDFSAFHGNEDDVKVSLISNLDLTNLEVGTKVTMGNFTIKAVLDPMTLGLSGEVSVSYKI